MKRAIVFLLLLATPAWGQQRGVNTSIAMPPPIPTSSGQVTLTLAEYNRLSELASKKPTKSDAPPRSYVLSRAAFKLRVEEQTVLGSVDLAGSVLEKSATKVPLTQGLTVLEAKQAGNSLPLLQEGPTHAAVINGPGDFSVSLSVASALNVEAGRATLVLAVPPASSSVLSLELPGNHANIRVEPGLITNRSTINGNTLVEATLEPGKPVRLWWTTREVAAPVAQREVRFLSSVKSVVSVGDSQLRAIALCDVTVVQGDVDPVVADAVAVGVRGGDAGVCVGVLAVEGGCDVMVEGERVPGEAAVRPKRCRDPLEAAATIGPRGQMEQRPPRAVDQGRRLLDFELPYVSFTQVELDSLLSCARSRPSEHRRRRVDPDYTPARCLGNRDRNAPGPNGKLDQ